LQISNWSAEDPNAKNLKSEILNLKSRGLTISVLAVFNKLQLIE